MLTLLCSESATAYLTAECQDLRLTAVRRQCTTVLEGTVHKILLVTNGKAVCTALKNEGSDT